MQATKLSGGDIHRHPTLFTADSKYFFTPCGPDVKMFSVTTGEQTRILRGHTQECVGAAINPDNPLQLYTFSQDHTIRLWDYNDALLLNTIDVGIPIHRFAFNPKQKNIVYLATHSDDDGNNEKSFSIYSFNLKTKESSQLIMKQSKELKDMQVTPDGEYILMLFENQFVFFELSTQKQYKYTHRFKLTCIGIHPKQHFVVTGDSRGELIYWYVFGREKSAGLEENALTSSYHWHGSDVGAVVFDSEGAHLYSGGKEMVLVIWQLDTGRRDFLPRLGAQIEGMVMSPDQTLIALRCSDNSIKLINARGRHVEVTVEGVTTYPWPLKTGLIVEPRHKHFAFNATDGQLQFYNSLEDRSIYKLQVGPANPVKDFMNFRIPESVVMHAAFSKNGEWLVTVDRRMDGRTPHLKFWLLDSKTQHYELNTQVNSPHMAKISSLTYHPIADMCVTTSADGRFKLWTVAEMQVETSENNVPRSSTEVCWSCKSVGFYRDLPARCSAFSHDGSLLAIGYQNIVTLWDPMTNTLLNTLTYTPPFEYLTKHIAFLPGSPHLVCCTKTAVYVWDLLLAQVKWSVSVSVGHLAVDPLSNRFAIHTSINLKRGLKGDTIVWKSDSPVPEAVAHIEDGVIGMAFLPSSTASQLLSHAGSNQNDQKESSLLVYLNANHEFVVLEEQTSSSTLKNVNEIGTPITSHLRDDFSKQINTKQLLEGPSVFRQIFGDPDALLNMSGPADTNEEEMVVDDEAENDLMDEDGPDENVTPLHHLPKVTTAGPLKATASRSKNAQANLQAEKRLKEMLDMPSHALPPTSTLFASFMDALVQRQEPGVTEQITSK